MTKSRGIYNRLEVGDVIGGMLVVGRLARESRSKREGTILAECSYCGDVSVYFGDKLKRDGGRDSCGCHRSILRSRVHTTHGHTVPEWTKTYMVWAGAKSRSKERGIDFYEGWEEFESFLKDMGEKPDGQCLSRVDFEEGYNPDNVIWTTKEDMMRRVGKWLHESGRWI